MYVKINPKINGIENGSRNPFVFFSVEVTVAKTHSVL